MFYHTHNRLASNNNLYIMYIRNHTHNRLASNNNLYIMYIHNLTHNRLASNNNLYIMYIRNHTHNRLASNNNLYIMYIRNHTHNRLASNNNLYIMYIHNHTIKETRAHQPASHRPLKYVLQLVNCQYCLKNYSFESLFLVPPLPPPSLSIPMLPSTLSDPYTDTA